ncbi:MAG TPA: peptidylprolyl isomerase [Methylococcaceae bacterium]|nr:peptidylprolyl isomerase [Methylococcaceae bacterium]
MLLKIREKSQGVFSWLILLMICVPFALWGIQNYLDVGEESPVATVGEKEFFQRDINRAYSQYSENFKGMNIDETQLKKLALEKLIRDEVLLQHVEDEGLAVTDKSVRDFVATLEYFQTDGKFDKERYQALLSQQKITSDEFVRRIKKAMIMEQFQRTIVESGFSTDYDVEQFFKIQNQTRSAHFVTVPLPVVGADVGDDEIQAYYQDNVESYRTESTVAIEYIELALDDLAKSIKPTSAQLEMFYQEQQDAFRTDERRKISHILLSDENKALIQAAEIKERLKSSSFATLAGEFSADKLSASKGGDLGLIVAGDMDPDFEKIAFGLAEGEVSDPVKTEFGYHIIKVTELTPGVVKPYEEVKKIVELGFKKVEAENIFYELGETLAEISFESPDTLDVAAESIGVAIQQTDNFTRSQGNTDISAEESVREKAFSEDVLAGNNSEVIELGSDRIVVLRVLNHSPSKARELSEVSGLIESRLKRDSAKQQSLEIANALKALVQSGKSLDLLAKEKGLSYVVADDLGRNNGDLPWEINRAIFVGAKPKSDQPTTMVVALESGEQAVVNLLSVTEGELAKADKKELGIARTNITKLLAEGDFDAVLSDLQADAVVNLSEL